MNDSRSSRPDTPAHPDAGSASREDRGHASTLEVSVWRHEAAQTSRDADRVAVEAPLEVRLNHRSFSVIMRTPGEDEALAAGFLFAEGVIRSAADLHHVVADPASSTIDVVLAPANRDVAARALEERRQVTLNSSCGLCGRRTIESLAVETEPLTARWAVDRQTVARLPAALRSAQTAFATTGGLHAAGLFDLGGRLEDSAEDVGRHNAVDKVIGRALLIGRLPLTRSLLCVSGRTSFEIVQKAQLAGVPLVAAVSAPSSLAVDLADRAGITLLGFVRDGRFNAYTHPGRVKGLGG